MSDTSNTPVRASRLLRLVGTAVGALALAVSVALVGPLPTAEAAVGRNYENSFARAANSERTQRDRVRLKWGRCLDRYAEAQARRMAKRQKLVHQKMGPILRNCDMRMVGENIAVGYPSGKAVTRAWMKSSGHRANILKKEYRRYGAGAYRDSNGRWWVSHVFGRRA
jgi:uncharacterized protein YkwD